MAFVMLCHIIACLWALTAQFHDNIDETWIADFQSEDEIDHMYLTAVYYTVTTITTVGYGDISINTKIEKWFSVVLILMGVIAFSLASGTLTSIIQNYDIENAKHIQQKNNLDKLYQETYMPMSLFLKLRRSQNCQSEKL